MFFTFEEILSRCTDVAFLSEILHQCIVVANGNLVPHTRQHFAHALFFHVVLARVLRERVVTIH
jgi:hypothetical protein